MSSNPPVPPTLPDDAGAATPPESLPGPVGGAPSAPPMPTPGTVFPSKSGMSPADQHHSMIGRVFNSIFTNKTTDWAQTPNGPVQVEREMAPGEVARGILAAAITGMAAGYSKPTDREGRAMPGSGSAGAAFGRGFQAVGAQREDVEAKKAAAAQQTFKNVGEAEERQIRAAENIRAQLRSVEESQRSQDLHQKAIQDFAKGNYDQSRKVEQDRAADLLTWNNYMDHGAEDVIVNGKPAVFPDLDHAEEVRTSGGHDAMMDSPYFRTRSVYNPSDHFYHILKLANDDDTPQWLGVKLNANGKPLLDKDGKRIADGSILDENLKPVVPSGMLTPKQARDQNETMKDKLLQRKNIQSEIDYRKVEGVAKLREEREKTKNDTAQQHFTAADGDFDKINPATGKPFITPGDRIILLQELRSSMALEYSIRKANVDALGTLDPKTQPEEYATAQKLAADSSSALGEYQNQLINLLHGKGTTDMNITPDQYQMALSKASTVSPEVAVANVKAAPQFNQATKDRLIADIRSGKGAKPAAAGPGQITTTPPDLSTLSPYQKIITDGKGKFSVVDASAGVPTDWTTTGVGTNQNAPPPGVMAPVKEAASVMRSAIQEGAAVK